jgi:hypothetical protein
LFPISTFRCERTFILSGIELPSPPADFQERQLQLKKLVKTWIAKLDPALSIHKIAYVRVIKAPKPSIVEVECELLDRYLFLTQLILKL